MDRVTRNLAGLAAVGVAIYAFAPVGVVGEHEAVPAVSAPDAPGVLVVDLVDGADDAELEELERALGADLSWVHDLARDEALAQGVVTDLDDAMAALAGNPLVEVVEPELQLEAFGYPDDPMYTKQWNLPQMGAPTGWSATRMGEGVIVAVVDTGVTKVEDLEGTTILKGATFVPGTKTSADDQGHGTHVAGTIAQTTNNGKGVAGVAPEATILPVKVLSGLGFGSSSWIAAGIDYAVDEGADVINLSLGGGYSLVIHNAIKKARKQGVIVVAAAGNSGREGVGYPGALTEVIGVSATGPGGGSLAPYSSWGKGVDLAAPGGDKRKPGGGVLQDTIDGRGGHTYAEFQGTSMASPHVAGAAAVLLSHGVTPDTVERVLLDSARGTGSWDPKLGHGELDLAAALGASVRRFGAVRFALGAVLALLVTQLAANGAAFRVVSGVLAGLVGGGLFFLHWVPLPPARWVDLLASGLLEWPGLLLDPMWTQFPLWLSALLPFAAALTLGAFRITRPLAMALCCGVGGALAHGAATGTLAPWWLAGPSGALWLAVNAVFCVVLAMALAGAEKLEEEGRA